MRPGDSLLHYRLVDKIGEGGMGVVWRARDTTLDREVAIKILPPEFALDPERLARFEREARVLASLNHPNIAAVYGFHEAGGVRFLAMELVAGDDLSTRIGRGPLPFDEALEAARQVAAALHAAHESGIVHRDLKPANVRILPDGTIKVLDFGLAKTSEAMIASGSGASMTRTSAGTAAGMILGTAAYMSPEQARGKPVDKRADVWAFGCLVYEMLTGRVAFPGETVTDVLVAIVHNDPDWNALPAAARPRLERALKRCLAKDPRERVRDLADVAILLREIGADRGAPVAGTAPTHRPWRFVAAVGVICLVLGALGGSNWIGRPAPATRALASGSHVAAMAQLTDIPGPQHAPSLSPDGKSLLFVAGDDGDEDIFLLRVGGENAVNLTASARSNDFDPAFSPDGERIAFGSDREGGGIFVMGATGESPRKVANEGAHPAWSPDGKKLVYTTERVPNPFARNTSASLFVVDVASGEKTKIYDGDAVQPVWSPSGRRIAFWSADAGQRDLRTIPAEGGPFASITNDTPADWDPFWSPDGAWLYFLSDRRGGPDLWRIAVDEAEGTARGEPEPVTTGVARPMQGCISADGRRIALTIDTSRGELLRAAFDPVAGKIVGEPVTLFSSARPFTQTDISDDGSWISYRTTSPVENVFVMRADGTGRRRLTDDAFRNRGPVWMKGTDWILFYSNRGGDYALWLVRRDGTDLRQLKTDTGSGINVPAVSRDGKRVAMVVHPDVGVTQLAIATVDDAWFGDTPPAVSLEIETSAGPFYPAAWSPDGSRITGFSITPRGNVAAVYTPATDRLELQRDPEGRDFGHWAGGAVWLPDGRRVLSWDDRRDVAILWDAEARRILDLPALPGPSDMDLSADGRTLVLNRSIAEGDIWMLTLE
ncbi:MAG TPA: protein kinase [Candidatus Polarisedimenticolaceae bacterium]